MIHDRRVLVIRVWLLLIAVPLLLPLFGFWVFYAASLMAFGLMMPILATAKCNLCQVGTTPTQMQLDISGIVQGAGSCVSCNSLNGTYVINESGGVFCEYTDSSLPGTCSVFVLDFIFQTPNNLITIPGSNHVTWSATGGTGQDCSAVISSGSWTESGASTTNCDFTGSSMTATPLAPLQ